MSNQSPSKSDVNNSSMTNDNNQQTIKEPTLFSEWTTELEKCMLYNMQRLKLKPCGINKHLSMHLLQRSIIKEMDIKIPVKVLWNYMASKWDIRAADLVESINFDVSNKDFSLPKEYDQLIIEQGEIIKKLQKECSSEEANKKKSLNSSGKTRSKSNSMSSVDSKEGVNETIPSTLLESSPAKKNEVGTDDGPCTRRSLRTNDKPENSKSDDKNKLNDSKQLNKKTSNKSKDAEKIELISNIRGRKMKSRNVSESSFSSDNSKKLGNHKNNSTDLTVSDSSSRSVTPEIFRGKTSNRSVTPEKISRNLRSSDKDQKSKLASEKANEVKAKIRSRVSSDLLVVQQSPDIQSLGRRSCSNKNL